MDQLQVADIDLVNWQRFAGAYGLRVMLKNGQMQRFGGFRETVTIYVFPSIDSEQPSLPCLYICRITTN